MWRRLLGADLASILKATGLTCSGSWTLESGRTVDNRHRESETAGVDLAVGSLPTGKFSLESLESGRP
jgi:hypothetical protein